MGVARPGVWRGAADGSVTRGQPTLGTGITPGKLGLIPDRGGGLEWFLPEKGVAPSPLHPPEDGAAAHQVVGGVMARQADNGWGP